MEIVKNPDIRVFASEAKSGEVVSFPDVLRGWGVTLDQTQGKPPLEWMNDAFNRIDLNNLYLLQQGIPEWDKAVRYPINSIIKHAGKIYLCVTENENNEPSSDSSKWSLYVKNATTTQKGIVQLTNNVDGSEDKAVTPRAVDNLRKEMLKATEVPVDRIFVFDGAIPPAGYIERKGVAINKETMPKLYERYGAKMPDDRDRVHRMAGTLAGSAGTTQEDAMQKITGGWNGGYINSPNFGSTAINKDQVYGKTGILMHEDFYNPAVGSKNSMFDSYSLDSSRETRTATETRTKARIIIACNKIQ